jgi:protein involved in polysaccharide export with SLBB domain
MRTVTKRPLLARAARMAAGVGACAALAGACAPASGVTPTPGVGPSPVWLREPLPVEYKLDVGDVVDLKLYYHPDLSDKDVLIRPDGRIWAHLVGDVTARGLTPTELARQLREQYATLKIEQPEVAVVVRKSAGLRVFVGGEVNNPGMIPHEGWMTVSRAILQAGGPKATAEAGSVVLLRDPGARGGGPLSAVLSLDSALAGGDDPLLQPYDVIFVPKSRIAKLNQYVDQYVVKMLPVTLSAGFYYTQGDPRNNPFH